MDIPGVGIPSNIKLITSGNAPTTDNLPEGHLAFGVVDGVCRLYCNPGPGVGKVVVLAIEDGGTGSGPTVVTVKLVDGDIDLEIPEVHVTFELDPTLDNWDEVLSQAPQVLVAAPVEFRYSTQPSDTTGHPGVELDVSQATVGPIKTVNGIPQITFGIPFIWNNPGDEDRATEYGVDAIVLATAVNVPNYTINFVASELTILAP